MSPIQAVPEDSLSTNSIVKPPSDLYKAFKVRREWNVALCGVGLVERIGNAMQSPSLSWGLKRNSPLEMLLRLDLPRDCTSKKFSAAKMIGTISYLLLTLFLDFFEMFYRRSSRD